MNAGKMDTIVRIQLTEERSQGSYQYADQLRAAFAAEKRFRDLEFSFNAGGMIRRRHQRGQDRPHQHPRQGQGPKNFAPDRRSDPPQGGQHRRRGRFPHHPAARLPRVHHRRRPGQGRRPGVNPGRRHEERHRRLQFEHSVQQDQLLDRRHQRQPVLRRRPVPAGKCRIDPNPARRAPHRRQPEQA